MKILLKACFE